MAPKKTVKEEAQDLKIEDFESENIQVFESELSELEQAVQEIPEKVAPPVEETPNFPKNEALIALLDGNGIPYCKTCWLQHQTNFMDSSPICPVNYDKCPRKQP